MLRALMAATVLAAWTAPIFADDTKKEEKDAPKVETEMVRIGSVQYPVPKAWTRQNPSSNMRIAQFGVPLAEGDEGKVEFVVFYFQGGGGSVDANIARWVGQFLEVDGKEKIEKIEADGLPITLVDIKGTYELKPFPMAPRGEPMKDYRMLAAIVETDEGPYFFRMLGPQKSLNEQEKSFENMFKKAEKK